MVHKRPFGGEESYGLACKHPRQLELSNQLASFVELLPHKDASQKPHTSGEGSFSKSQGDERIINDTGTDLSIGAVKEFEISAPGSNSSFSWVTSSTSEEDARSEAAVHVSFSPECFKPDRSTRPEEIYSSLLVYPPRRPVSVGPDHQADVPLWSLQDINNTLGYLGKSDRHIAFPQSLGSDLMDGEDNAEKLMGTCVIPMPDLEASAYDDDKVGYGRTDCSCLDGGSVRCVREHVMEAREKLRRTLGQERFVELGFCDMGEEVARKWSEEEVFHEVVRSNPASMGRNFWDHLFAVFPSRTKKDIVSYYFNVFMLHRRAEQNRSDPLNIDSDNDEGQGSDDGDDELGMTEEDEDSMVESLVDQDDPGYSQDHEEDFHEDDEDGNETCYNNDDDNVDSGRGVTGEEDEDDVSEAHIGKSFDDCSFDPMVHLLGKIPPNDAEDHDVQDDSCTSYECQPNRGHTCDPVDTSAAPQENRVGSDYSKHLQGSYDGLSYGAGLGYGFESCDAKVWDIGYLTGPNKEVDFLSTCNMIEEVFGNETWNNKASDGKDIS